MAGPTRAPIGAHNGRILFVGFLLQRLHRFEESHLLVVGCFFAGLGSEHVKAWKRRGAKRPQESYWLEEDT